MFWIGKTISPEEVGGKSKEDINLSPIEVIILAQLRSRELRNNEKIGQYGYEMINQLNDLFAGSWEAKSGTIYPILSKLESNKKMIQGTRRKSPLGPVKKVYILTELGRISIDSVMYNNMEQDFDFILQYFNMLTPFLIHIRDTNEDRADEMFEKVMAIPAKGAVIAMEDAVTEIDEKLRIEKLKALKKNLTEVLSNVSKELN